MQLYLGLFGSCDLCFSPLHLVHHFQWWRMCTAVCIHSSYTHLVIEILAFCFVMKLPGSKISRFVPFCIVAFIGSVTSLVAAGLFFFYTCGWGGLFGFQCYFPSMYVSCFSGAAPFLFGPLCQACAAQPGGLPPQSALPLLAFVVVLHCTQPSAVWATLWSIVWGYALIRTPFFAPSRLERREPKEAAV
eukprot:EG_transcript_18314